MHCSPYYQNDIPVLYLTQSSFMLGRHSSAQFTSSKYINIWCFFLLLLWLYNSLCRVLVFSTDSFHLLLSWTRVFQFGTFDFCISFLTSTSQRVFGLPTGFLEMGFQEYTALTILVSCILSMWPSHPSLCALM